MGFAFNTYKQSNIGTTPFQLLHGFEAETTERQAKIMHDTIQYAPIWMEEVLEELPEQDATEALTNDLGRY